MLGSMHQRLGDDAAGATSTDTDQRRAWGRGIYADQSAGGGNGFQIGTDLFASGNWRAGLYAGSLSGTWVQQSRYLGGYATWRDASGLYVDTVLQGVNRSIGSNGAAVSVEVGKAFALNETWSFEPRAQLIYQYERNAGRLYLGPSNSLWSYTNINTLSGRFGARVKGDFSTAAGSLQPYANIDTVGVSAGATLGLSKTVDVYGEIGRHWSTSGEWGSSRSNHGSVGMKVRW